MRDGGRRSRGRRRSGGRRSAGRRAPRAYARSALHSRSKRTWSAIASPPANAAQSPIQYGTRARRSPRARRPTPGASGSASSPASPRTRTATCTASRPRPAARAAAPATTTAGRGEPVDERVRLLARAGRRAARSGAAGFRSSGEASRVQNSRQRWNDPPMPFPKTTTAPRIQIQRRRAAGRLRSLRRQGGRRRPRRGLGDDLPRRATRCSARPCASSARRARAGRSRRSSRSATTASRVGFEVDAPGRWTLPVEAWVDRVASYQWEIRRASSTRARRTSRRARRGRGAARRRVAHGRGGARREAGDRSEKTPSQTLEVDVDRERGAFGSWYELFPRSWGGFAGVERGAPRARGARLRRRLPAADPPDRDDEPQGAEQHARRRRRATSAARGRSAGGGRARRRPSRARHARGVRARWSRAAARSAARSALDFAIQCSPDHPWLTRASRVVPPPPGRDAEVRGEPAQEVPGHLQRQLRLGGLARALAGAARRRPLLGRARRARSSASTTRTRSRPVLGVADRGGAARATPTSSSSPRRSRGRR